jgi:hypothetical protein
MVSSGIAAQTATPTVVYEVSNDAAGSFVEGGLVGLLSVGMGLAAVATLMIML